MALINKYRYLQALFIGLPIGLLSLYYGSKYIIEKPKDLTELNKKEAIVDTMFNGFILNKDRTRKSKAYIISLESDSCFSIFNGHINKLQQNIDVNDTIIVWYKNTNYKKIAALKKNNQFIIEYNRGGYWIGIFFIVLGLFFAIISFLYIIKHPKDLTGKKKNKEL
jgi:hypothetical protein